MADLTDGQKVTAGYWEGISPSDNEIETNKAVTINGAEYASPVEVTPTGEYDAMKKVTVTVSVSLFAWKNDTSVIYTKTEEPKTTDKAMVGASTGITESAISAIGEDFASITVSTTEYARYETGDIELL